MKFLIISIFTFISLNAFANPAASCDSQKAKEVMLSSLKVWQAPPEVAITNIKVSKAMLTVDINGDKLPYKVVATFDRTIEVFEGYTQADNVVLVFLIDPDTCKLIDNSIDTDGLQPVTI